MNLFGDIDYSEIENEELSNLVDQVMDLFDDFVDSAELIIKKSERALVLAREEKSWYLYFEFYSLLFLEATCYGDPRKTIYYAEQFFRDCVHILPEAAVRYANTDLTEGILNCFSSIAQSYQNYHQINDQRLAEFMAFYEKIAKQYGQEFTYWRSLLEYGLNLMDAELIQKGYEGIRRHPYDDSDCYVCIQEEIIGYLAFTKQFDPALHAIHKIIRKQAPPKYRSDINSCPASNAAIQYRHLLDFYAKFGEKEAYQSILEQGVKEMTFYRESYSRGAEMAYHLAVGNSYPTTDQYINMFATDVSKGEETGSTYTRMRSMLFWRIYFRKLNEHGIQKLKIPTISNTSNIPNNRPTPDQTGMTPTSDIIKYCDQTADNLGRLFSESRKNFNYANLKHNLETCADCRKQFSNTL